MLLEAIITTDADWTSIWIALIGIVTGGSLLKLISLISENNKQKRVEEKEPEMALRDALQDQIQLLIDNQEHMRERVEVLIAENAGLKVQLETANRHIADLSRQIEDLRR